MMILLVDLQMLGEVIDTLSQQRNLDLGRTRIRGMRAKVIYNSLRVVHEVLSYASKWSGECPSGMIARFGSIEPSEARSQMSEVWILEVSSRERSGIWK